MYRVDTHIITLPGWGGQRADWYDRCLASIVDQPTNIHFIKGTRGHVGKGRAEGFATGNAEYVSYVDPDDYLEPGIIQHMTDWMDQNPNIDVCCCPQNVIAEDGTYRHTNNHNEMNDEVTYRSLLWMHPLVFIRRKALMPHLESLQTRAARCEFILWFEMYEAGSKFAFIDKIGYNWRAHDNSSHKLNLLTEEDAKYMQELFDSLEGL